MTDINDLYEPGDDREPEPPDEHDEPIDLDEIEATLADAKGDPEAGAATAEVLAAVPHLIAELRQAREQLTYWRALPIRQEYAITDGPHPDQASVIWPGNAEDALRLAEDPGRTGWVRSVTVHGWAPLAAEAPF